MLGNKIAWTAVLIELLVTKCSCYSDNIDKIELAKTQADQVMNQFFMMFVECYHNPMANQRFIVDNMHSFINHPARTTVGFAPKFTANRRFFANLIATPEFRELLALDEKKITDSLVEKMQFCESTVMDKTKLKEYYDRPTGSN